jgi:hypothetical protein
MEGDSKQINRSSVRYHLLGSPLRQPDNRVAERGEPVLGWQTIGGRENEGARSARAQDRAFHVAARAGSSPQGGNVCSTHEEDREGLCGQCLVCVEETEV